jgi:hypothetical protein
VVGVGKRCRRCYNRLAKILESPQARFQLPGTTGVIFPWAPPIGTPLYILDALNHDLTDILLELLDILRQFMESQIDSSKSNQSSPSYNAYQSQVDEMQEEQMRSEDGVVPPSVWSL